MFNIEEWISDFSQKIQENFKSRIEFIGLQGSYAREEATEGSDIDVVVIFDKLKMDDLKKYDEIISKMSCREKICGFLSGKDELANWEKSTFLQLNSSFAPAGQAVPCKLCLRGRINRIADSVPYFLSACCR